MGLMKKGLLALLILCIIGLSAYAQDTSANCADKHKVLVNLLQEKIKQIVNKSIHYNYYLGDDLYTEKSFISDATVTYQNNKLVIYFYISTQKYDLHSSQ